MRLYIKTKPRAKETSVERVDESHYVVHVTSVPSKGKANEAVIAALSRHFHTAKSKIALVRGGKSKEKIVEIIE